MRLSKPDDELGSTLLMCLPSVAVHDIDEWSPLRYIMLEYNKHKNQQHNENRETYLGIDSKTSESATSLRKRVTVHNPSKSYEFPDVLQREIDTRNGNREIKENESAAENPKPIPKEERNPTDAHNDDEEIAFDEEENALRQAMVETKAEIVVLIEGIDATTSYTIQARHSYTSSDILYHHDFVPCVSEVSTGGAVLDFSKFHDVIPVHGKDKYSPPKHLFSSS
uniref:Inward rectifier potassium channel C-terminal domain-containing protein n=1 Tax=Aplanochytrium stocchinoi TaxID=215587 RepID=A0A7S3LGG8_9STRA